MMQSAMTTFNMQVVTCHFHEDELSFKSMDQHSNHSTTYKMKFHLQHLHLDYSKSMFVSISMHLCHDQVIPFVHCHVVYHICLLRELWFVDNVVFEANHIVCLDIFFLLINVYFNFT